LPSWNGTAPLATPAAPRASFINIVRRVNTTSTPQELNHRICSNKNFIKTEQTYATPLTFPHHVRLGQVTVQSGRSCKSVQDGTRDGGCDRVGVHSGITVALDKQVARPQIKYPHEKTRIQTRRFNNTAARQ
jgi:hypothetical protein